MDYTITLPLESVVTIGKNGKNRIEHTKVAKFPLTKELAEKLLLLMGTTPEKAIQGALEIQRKEET